jgi:hypothetical protein
LTAFLDESESFKEAQVNGAGSTENGERTGIVFGGGGGGGGGGGTELCKGTLNGGSNFGEDKISLTSGFASILDALLILVISDPTTILSLEGDVI